MSVLVHKTYSIAVHAIPAALDPTLFVPTVDISLKNGKQLLKMTTTQAFAAESDARVRDGQELD
jgi:hypothetical protein